MGRDLGSIKQDIKTAGRSYKQMCYLWGIENLSVVILSRRGEDFEV